MKCSRVLRIKLKRNELDSLYIHIFTNIHTWYCMVKIVCQLTLLHLNALGLEQVPQFLYLLLELPDQFGICVLIDHSLADNLLGTIRITIKPEREGERDC